MHDNIDYSTLSWVKQEIDETLDQARHALEDYVENPDDATQLRFCSTYIHQVYGTLQMVELYGAALFSEEMEQLAQALSDDTVAHKDEAYEVLMRAILQLPEYLERVQTGLADDPLILLPLLNDLRAARGQNLLSENSLFAPDLAVAGPLHVERRTPGANVAKLAKKLRHKFQVGLLAWYRDQDSKGGLGKMREVLTDLERACEHDDVVRLWWVAGGVVEALLDDGLSAGLSLKQLLGQVDREIKGLIDHGEAESADSHATELLKNLLYYVARASSAGERVSAVKDKFKLGGMVPSANELETARERLAGPNLSMMRTVSEAIREDLASVKDALDLYLRSNEPKVSDLEPQVETLRKVADTLGMLGLGIPRKLIQEQGAVVADILSGAVEANETRMMEIAGSLLFVESSLDGLMQSRIARGSEEARAAHESEGAPTRIPRAEFQQIKSVVMKEISGSLAKAKDAVIAFIDAPWDHDLITDVPQMIEQVRGALEIISLEHAARLLGAINDYIREQLLQQRRQPSADELDQFADAVSSVEYYLEAVDEPGRSGVSILRVAHESLEKLGYPVETPAAVMEDEVTAVAEAADDFGAAPFVMEDEAIESVEIEALPAEIDAQPAEIAIEESDIEEITLEAPPATDVPIESPEPKAFTAPPALANDIDDDILDIFVEEAEEELAAINEMMPRWENDTDNFEPLQTVRRSFHTLKGSGRLVGALDIGELAWSIENMLNRVLDQTIPVHADMVGLIHAAADAVPGLLVKLRGGTPPEVDVQELTDRGFALVEAAKAAGTSPEDQLAEEARSALPADESEQDARPAEVMDPTLFDIFSKESAGHLDEIKAFIDACQSNAQQCAVTDALVRALHTLHGSARMAGAKSVAELGGLLEKYVKALMSNEAPLPADGMSALVDGVGAIYSMLGDLNRPGVNPLEAWGDLLERVRVLCTSEQARLEDRLRQEQIEASGAQAGAGEDQAAAEYDTELVEVFLEEGAEIMDSSEMILQRWSKDTANLELVVELQRELHTLKGGARMAGIAPIGDLSHAVESLLSDIAEGKAAVSSPVIDVLRRVLDRLFMMLERTQERRAVEPAPELVDELEDLRHGRAPAVQTPDDEAAAAATTGEDDSDVSATVDEPESAPEALPHTAAVVPFPVRPTAAERAAAEAAEEHAAKRAQGPQEMVRVRAELLDGLVNYAGEVSIYRARLEQQNGAFRFNLVELGQTVARLREQLRKLEIETEAQVLYRYEQEGGAHEGFDPLEMDRYSQMQQLSRALMESVADISSIDGLLGNLVRESETLLLQQSRVNTELQEGLMRTRMVPFTGLVPRLRRLVRQTCQELGKTAELHVLGAQGEMDRTVLDRIQAPLEHMLRNAISHGIETPQARKKLGKPETGNITLSVTREGAEVVIQMADDGAGMDLGAIRAKARERGLLDEHAQLTDNDIIQFILESGFSTAQQVTQISGRGVGMDVVNSEIKQLGGSLHIDSRLKHGSAFTIRLPFTLALNQALLVAVAEDTYAIPLTSIEGIVRLPRAEVEHFLSEPNATYSYAGMEYQVQNLGAVLGSGSGHLAAGAKVFPVLLVRSGDRRMALQVDGLLGSREIVVKSVGPQISTVRGISGATILGDGRVVLILDVAALTRVSISTRLAMDIAPPESVQAPKRGINVMVVDDSITVRKVTTRLLERNEMHVVTAKDGVDAVTLLQEHVPDVMLLDIEMPRMDGFELATHIRNEPRLKHIPIIMITSRSGDKHRRRAEEIGVNRYLGKPFQETDLLQNIQELVKEPRGDT